MVNFSSNSNKLNKKRGISTIVGGIIFLILLTAGFSAFFVAMDVQSDTIDAQRTISDSLIDKTQEQFAIAVATDETNNNKLGIHVKNQGPNPVEISNIWIINKSEANQPIKKIEVDYSDAFIPPGYGSSILEHQPLYMLPNDYDIKVVSTLGTIEKSELKVGGNNYLLAEMFAIPPDVRLNENVTLALRVTNVGPTMISGVAPGALLVDDVPLPHPWVAGTPELVSLSPVDLNPSESTIFSMQAKLSNAGTVGNKLKFSNLATGTESVTGFAITSNTASDKITIRVDEGGEGEEIVLKDELFAKPEIFMIVPNIFGKSNQKAFWGISVANPTDAIMDVSKVTVSILFAGSNDNHKVFDSGCPLTEIFPTTNWNCPNQNQLVWKKGAGSPISIGPRSVHTFLAAVEPYKPAGGTAGLDAVIIHTNVFTTLGSFGKTSHQTSLTTDFDVLANVYLSTNTNNAVVNSEVRGNRTGITGGSLQTFTIALAELNTDEASIQEDSTLIINIPKDWGVPTVTGNTGFSNIQTPPPFPDGSSQITADLTNDLASGKKTITFTSTAPTPTSTKMYVMHILADGESSSLRPIGPISETVLQVCGISGCP